MSALSMLTEEQAAEYIQMSVHYLRKDRVEGKVGNRTPGPRYMKKGRRIRYATADLDAWLQSGTMPTHEERAQQRRAHSCR